MISLLFATQLYASIKENHPDQGELLCFSYTNYDHGLQFMNNKDYVYFPFYNCSGKDVVLDQVYSNKERNETFYVWQRLTKNDTIKAGTYDSIAFKRKKLYSLQTGLHDNSFSLSFKNSNVVQHLNIFCEMDSNTGKLIAETITLPKVDRGSELTLVATVKNIGGDPVQIYEQKQYGYSSDFKALDKYPIQVMPYSEVKLNFKVNTENFLNTYSGELSFETNEEYDSYTRLKIPYKGTVHSVNHPSIKFDSLILHKFTHLGGNGMFHFWFENDGDKPLIISYAKTSCGCLVATWPREPIKPGERGEIEVRYDTKRIGPINKSITVKHNASSVPIILRVKGLITKEKTKEE